MTKSKSERLTVRELHGSDMYKDMIRAHWKERGGISNGAIARVTVNGKTELLAMRGFADQEGKVGLDHLNRDHLGLKNDVEYEFSFAPGNLLDGIRWARKSADPAARIATFIAIWSGVIGVIGVILALIGLYPVVKEMRADWIGHHAKVNEPHSPSTSGASPPPQGEPARPEPDHK